MGQIKRVVEDLALSIGVHPWAFGFRPEGTGHLVLPPGITIEAIVVEKLFAFRNRSDVATKTYKWRYTQGEIITIPAFIQRLKIRVGPTGIRAVVVVGHHNLRTPMAKPEAVPGVILVATSGSAGASTTELLYMLDIELSGFPFLYVSDHDFPGFQIYYNLKYGSNDRAYCSHISVCSRLQWVGSTKVDLAASSAGYKEEKLELHKAHHSN